MHQTVRQDETVVDSTFLPAFHVPAVVGAHLSAIVSRYLPLERMPNLSLLCQMLYFDYRFLMELIA